MNYFFVTYSARGWGSPYDYGSDGPPLRPDREVHGSDMVALPGPFVLRDVEEIVTCNGDRTCNGTLLRLEGVSILSFQPVDEETYAANRGG